MKFVKNFKKWHDKKSAINEIEKWPFFHEREIWFCYLGANVGFEQDGGGEEFLRPVLVFRKFNNEIFWAIPLSKIKKGKKKNPRFYVTFSFIKGIESAAVLSQVRLIDAKRLSRKIGDITEIIFREITKKFKALIP